MPDAPAVTPPAVAAAPRRQFAFLRRTLPLLLLLAAALWYFRDAPRDFTVAMDLAGRRDGLKELRLELVHLPGREVARHVELFYSPSTPAPTQLRSAMRAPPGDYEATLVFDYGGRTERVERRFTFESQDEVVLPP